MVDPRYITFTVQYDREPKYGRSLEWIAPELKNSALTMIEDHLDDPAPSRTWAGIVNGQTYEQFAKSWLLPTDADDTGAPTASRDRDLAVRTYTLDGMNWEAGNRSPIVYVSLRVVEWSSPHRPRPRAGERIGALHP
jgi:hypothetical protein